MKGYYFEAVKKDVINAIVEGRYFNIDTLKEMDIDEAFAGLDDELFIDDSVTGNASGSYFCNSYMARETVLANMKEVVEALTEFCYEAEAVGKMFLNEEYEKLDVITRCYFLNGALYEVLEEVL